MRLAITALDSFLLLSVLMAVAAEVGEGRERLQLHSHKIFEQGILDVKSFQDTTSRRILRSYSKEKMQPRSLLTDTDDGVGDYSPTANSDPSPTPPFLP